jgi:hypothetical protein
MQQLGSLARIARATSDFQITFRMLTTTTKRNNVVKYEVFTWHKPIAQVANSFIALNDFPAIYRLSVAVIFARSLDRVSGKVLFHCASLSVVKNLFFDSLKSGKKIFYIRFKDIKLFQGLTAVLQGKHHRLHAESFNFIGGNRRIYFFQKFNLSCLLYVEAEEVSPTTHVMLANPKGCYRRCYFESKGQDVFPFVRHDDLLLLAQVTRKHGDNTEAVNFAYLDSDRLSITIGGKKLNHIARLVKLANRVMFLVQPSNGNLSVHGCLILRDVKGIPFKKPITAKATIGHCEGINSGKNLWYTHAVTPLFV